MAVDSQMSNIFSSQPLNDAEDELAIFGGQTRVLTRKTKRKLTGTATVSSPESHSPEVTPTSPTSTFLSMPDVHPSLIEYLKHDSLRKSHMHPQSQSSLHYANTPSSPSSMSQNSLNRRSGSDSPSRREMGEMYNGFMGYLASKSISNTPVPPGVVPPSMRNYRPPTQGSDAPVSRYSNGNAPSPSAMNTWEQPPARHSQQSYPHQNSSSTMVGTSTTDADALNAWMALNPANAGFSPPPNQYFVGPNTSSNTSMNNSANTMPVHSGMGDTSGALFDARTDPLAFRSYGIDPYLRSTINPGTALPALSQNPTDPMVEMGLTSESGMDEGWLSFMRECGIMDNGRPPT